MIVSYLDRDAEGELREVLPMPYFLDAAMDYGYATFFTDAGVESVREGTAALGIGAKHALSLAGCLYAHIKGLNTGEIRQLEWGKRYDKLPGSREEYRRTIDYTGPPYQFYRGLDHEMPGGIPAFQSQQVTLFPPPVLQAIFRDKIVLIGSGLDDAPDRYRTPFFSMNYGFEKTFGVEIHAHFLRTLLSPQPLRRSGFFLAAFLILGPAFLVALATVRLRPYLALPFALVMILLLWGLGFYLFVAQHLIVPLATPTLSAGLACLFGLAYLGSTEGKQKDEVRDRFSPMVGPAQLQEVLEQPKSWSTEGEERIVSVLWIRLQIPNVDRSHRSVRETVSFFQDYWSRMSEAIFKHGGTVCQYEEEYLTAVFGTPLPQKAHAVLAALAAIDAMESWIALRKARERRTWDLAIGADTGRALIGELGGDERSAYRVLGRPVDRAYALTGGRDGAGNICVTREFWAQVHAHVESVPLGRNIYRICGRAHAPPIGAADRPPNPFWKYFGFGRKDDGPISEELLDSLTLFSDFNRRDLRRIRPILYHRTYKAGERVFSLGEVGSALYIIQRGTVDIMQESDGGGPPELLQRLNAGDFFGELALLSDLHRSASAVAYEPSELLVLFQTDLYDLIEREPELGVRLIRSLSRITAERQVHLNEELIRIRRESNGFQNRTSP